MQDGTTITSIAELSVLVDKEFGDDKWTTVVYRGHGAASFQLRPKVGRLKPLASSKSGSVNESLMLELFRRQSVGRLELTALDDWELLAVAQHHGLATRLLDWTRSPLAALYFCVCNEVETRDNCGRPMCEDAELIAWRAEKEDLSKPLPRDPLKIKETIRYIPRVVTPRLRAQSGVFTAHHAPNDEFKPPSREVIRLRIPHDRRRLIKKSLFKHGIHEAVLFPDVDALARHIQWCQSSCY